MVKFARNILTKAARRNSLYNKLLGGFDKATDGGIRYFSSDHLRPTVENPYFGVESIENYDMSDVSKPYPPTLDILGSWFHNSETGKERERLNNQLRQYWEQKAKEGYKPVK